MEYPTNGLPAKETHKNVPKMLTQTPLKPVLFGRTLRTVVLGVFAVSVFTLSLLGLTTTPTSAATSATLNFQARLQSSSGGIIADGNYNVEFKLYDASSSSGSAQGSCTGDAHCLWTETRTGANQVRVYNGYLTVNLGSVTGFPSTINWNQQLYLTMNVGGTGTPSWDGEMSPRLQLTAVPYAFQAGVLSSTDASGHIGTLSFPTSLTNATDAITLPDASGTVCLQSSSSCGFAAGSGSAFLQGGNSFGAQAVLGTNDNNSLALRTNGSNRLVLDTSGNLQFQQASTFNIASAATGTQLTIQGGAATSGTNVGGNLLLQGGAGASTGASGSVIVKSNTNNSTTAFQVQNASGTSVLNVDTSNQRVGIGIAVPINTLSVSPVDYQTGTVTRTNGSATLTGTGTTWTSAMVGDTVVFADGTTNTVAGFTSTTSITMGTTYTGTTDSSPVSYAFYNTGLQVTSAGNVGIGTTSPQYTLDVAGTIRATGAIYANGGVYVGSDTDLLGNQINLQSGSGTSEIAVNYSGKSNIPLTVYNGAGSAKVRLNPNGDSYFVGGQLGVGTSGPTYSLDVHGNFEVTESSAGNFAALIANTGGGSTNYGERIAAGQNSSANSGYFIQFTYGNQSTQVGSITGNGGGGVNWNSGSDFRIKTNIADTHYGLDNLLQIPVVDYHLKNNPTGSLETGFIAQWLYSIYPNAVTPPQNPDDWYNTFNPNDIWTVDYGKLTPLLVKSVQDLNTKVDQNTASLNARIDAIQANTDFSTLNVSGPATVTNLTVTGGATFQGDIVVNGHIITAGSTPTATALPAAGVDVHGIVESTCTVAGNDTSGQISIKAGTDNLAQGMQCSITFATPFGQAPHSVLSATNQNAASAGLYAVSTATQMTIYFSHFPQAGQQYDFNYWNPQ